MCRDLICSGLFNPNGDIKMRYAFCRCAMSRKYYRLLKSSLRGRDPFFNVVTLIVVEIVALALTQPANPWVIGAGLVVEQFGYGFGFTAYMMFMIMVAEGEHKTAHYAISSALMAASFSVNDSSFFSSMSDAPCLGCATCGAAH